MSVADRLRSSATLSSDLKARPKFLFLPRPIANRPVLLIPAVLLIAGDALRLFLLPHVYQLGFTDAFEAIVVFLAAAACIRAAQQSSGISRVLWATIALYFVLNVAVDAHDFIADSPLGISHVGISHAIAALDFLGWCTYFPLALILFFPISEDARLKWKWIPIIDFVQVAIAAAVACFELVYLYHRNLNEQWTQFGSPEAVRNALICTGLLLRGLVDPSRHARKIYNAVGLAFASITLVKLISPAYEAAAPALIRPAAFMGIGIFAACWNGSVPDSVETGQRRNRLRLILGMLATAMLVVVLMLVNAAPLRYRTLANFIGAVSIVLFILRSTVGEYIRYGAEKALRDSEDRYRDLVENSEDLVCTHDLTGKLLTVNAGAARMLGYEASELLGIPMREFVAPEFRAQFDQYLERISANGADAGFLCVLAKDGRRRIWEYRNTLRTKGVSNPVVRGMAHDVTQRRQAENALRRSEQRMRLFIEHAPAGVALLDREMRYIEASRRWRDDYGLGDREIVGISHYEVFPEIPERWKEAHRRCLAGEIVREDCDPFQRADGNMQWIRWELHPWYDQGGIGGIAIFAEDVSARELANQALRESEERYRALFEKSVAGVGIINMAGNVVDCNDAWARMFGFSEAADCRGGRIEDHCPDPAKRESLLVGLRKSEVRLNQEYELCRKDGAPFWVLLNSVLLKLTNGESLIQSTMFEITKRKHAEDALRRSEEHFRILVEQASDGIFIADSTGKYVDVNSAGAEMLGYRREDILQFSISDVLVPEERHRVGGEISRLSVGDGVRSEWNFQRKDGSTFPGEVSARSLPDGRLQGILRDQTDRKRAEEILRQSEERFRVALKDSPITVFNQDHDLRYTWLYNPQLYWQHDVLGKTDDEIIGPKRAAFLNQLKRRVLDSGVGLREEVAIPSNGKSHVFDITVEPLFDAARNVIGITAACMDIARLREMTDRLQESRDRLANEKSYLEKEIQTELGFEEIIGQSPALRDVLKKARIVAPTDSTVLLLGETGTGKELVARSIHGLSSRHSNTFVKLNCAAVPSGLLESELFGHEKGAFTGAVNQKIGRIELADKGTLFLDEIGEMPLELQPKLLRVLQDREFERLGGVRTLRVDVRIVSATNRDLRRDVAEKKFREDLYYRLNVFPIELPPLRQRRDDVEMLVQHFVRKYSLRMGKHIDTIPAEAMRRLSNWSWPGNVRELENMVERMVIMSKGTVLAAPPSELSDEEYAAEDNLSGMEREHIIRVLRETNGVLSGIDGAASRLGLKRTTLQSKIKRLGIDPHEYRNDSATGTFAK